MAASGIVDDVLAMFKANGGRSTSARRAILQALVDNQDDHTSAEKITEAVQRTHPDVAPSTVYRFLDELERLNLVDHVHLVHGTAVYHFTDHRHDHLVCNVCDRVIEVPPGTLDPLREIALQQFGFEVPPRHFAVTGSCKECSMQADAEADGDDTGSDHGHAPHVTHR